MKLTWHRQKGSVAYIGMKDSIVSDAVATASAVKMKYEPRSSTVTFRMSADRPSTMTENNSVLMKVIQRRM
jgi:hypothetical protein